MRSFYNALLLVVVMASCKKDKIVTLQETKPDIDVISDNPDGDEDLSGVKILQLDLSTGKFIPSTSPLLLSSVAIGRKSADTISKTPLTYSGWTHPAVLRFRNKWNNYYYWAAITPYPNVDSQYENPHIFCSNDGKTWIEPPGIINPIEPVPSIQGYNSDVNLLREGEYLYCYWREVTVVSRTLWVKKSLDGIHWSEREFICKVPVNDKIDFISPAVVKDGDQYQCYAVCGPEKDPGNYYDSYSIRRMVSNDATKGFTPEYNNGYELVTIENRPWGSLQDPWHLEVKKVSNIWLMLVTTTNHKGYGSGGKLYMGYSSDGKSFSFIETPICDAPGSTYKSSFHPRISKKGNCIDIELWRSMTSYGWAIFYDKFSIKLTFAPIA